MYKISKKRSLGAYSQNFINEYLLVKVLKTISYKFCNHFFLDFQASILKKEKARITVTYPAGATTLSITTLSMTFFIKGLVVTLSINGTQCNNTLSLCWMSAECRVLFVLLNVILLIIITLSGVAPIMASHLHKLLTMDVKLFTLLENQTKVR